MLLWGMVEVQDTDTNKILGHLDSPFED